MDNTNNGKIGDFNTEALKSPMLEKVIIDENVQSQIKSFVKEVVSSKTKEEHHKKDNGQEEKRWYTGFSGESALEKFLGQEFVDLSVGNSNAYHVSDLSKLGLDIGVKTVEKGKFPIIFKKSKSPQVIIIKSSDSKFCICGLATIEVLNNYQSDELILSPALRSRGTKTGFYGFEHLKKFENIEDLRMMTKHVKNGTKIISKGNEFVLTARCGKYHMSGKDFSGVFSFYSINKKLKKMSVKEGIYYE
jgi:hypothetical protein